MDNNKRDKSMSITVLVMHHYGIGMAQLWHQYGQYHYCGHIVRRHYCPLFIAKVSPTPNKNPIIDNVLRLSFQWLSFA